MTSQLVLSFIEHGDKAEQHIVSRCQLFDQLISESRAIHDRLNQYLRHNPQDRPVIHSPQSAYQIIQPFLENLDHEEFWVCVLDQRNRVVRIVALYRGTVNCAHIRVSEIFRIPIIENAPSIILFHNHPSGDPTPSPEDITLTRTVREAGKLLDIEVIDHIVIGSSGNYVSLKERGLGF